MRYFKETKHNLRQVWNFIKEIIKITKTKKYHIRWIKVNNKYTMNINETAVNFNNYIHAIVGAIDRKVSKSNIKLKN